MFDTNPVVRGLLGAMQLSQMFQRMSLERESMERTKRKDARNERLEDEDRTRRDRLDKRGEQMQDLDLQTKLLAAGGKPVENGRYSQDVSYSIDNPLLGGAPQTTTISNTQVPVDAGRTVKTPAGQEMYIPTRGEQFEDQLRELRAVTDVKTQSAIQVAKQKLDDQLILEGIRQGGQNNRLAATLGVRVSEGEANRTQKDRLFSKGEAGRNARNAASNATRLTAAERGRTDTRKEVNGRDLEIQKTQNRYEQVARLLRAGGRIRDERGNTVNLKPEDNTPERQALEGEMKALTRKLRLLRKQNEGAELVGSGGAGTWDDYKKGLK